MCAFCRCVLKHVGCDDASLPPLLLQDDHVSYSGVVTSSIRNFVGNMARWHRGLLAVPYPKEMHRPPETLGENTVHSSSWYIALSWFEGPKAPVGDNPTVEVTGAFAKFREEIDKKAYRKTDEDDELSCTFREGMGTSCNVFKRSKLPLFVFPNGKRPKKKKNTGLKKSLLSRVGDGGARRDSNISVASSRRASIASIPDVDTPSEKRKREDDVAAKDTPKEEEVMSKKAKISETLKMQNLEDLSYSSTTAAVSLVVRCANIARAASNFGVSSLSTSAWVHKLPFHIYPQPVQRFPFALL